ncbi:MAG: SRPBCC family protein [Mycobacterium sp.]
MSPAPVIPLKSGRRKVALRVQVAAPAAEIFALLVDPHRHPELDGSGTVRDIPIDGPHRLTPGAKFTVGMKQLGVPYKITSTATVVEENKVIEWQHPMGHRWRWELVETAPGTTDVTEIFDYSTAKAPLVIEVVGFHKKNAQGITTTLERLAARYS